jgi:hypothetical protein
MYKVFSEKFGSLISSFEFKKSAEMVITSESGKKCSRSKFAEESSKRRKSIVDLFEENYLSELKLYTKVRDQLKTELANLKTLNVEEVPRTKKIPSEKQDTIVIDLINQAIAEILPARKTETLSDIAKVLQAAQLTYQAINTKPSVKSNWSENIKRKLTRLKNQ